MKNLSGSKGVTKALIIISCLLVMVSGACRAGRRSPEARHGAKMVYDSVENQVVLFGGRGNGGVSGDLFNDLWILDLDAQKWEKADTASGPSSRLSPGLVYDPFHHQLILFGGYRNSGRVDDTWLLDLDSLEWQEIFPAESPPARSDMGMAFDEENQIVVLFGGYCLEFEREVCDDTWIFDPATNEWVEMEPASSPPVMYGLSLDYDTQGNRMLLFGGHMSRFSQGGMSSAGYNDSIWLYTYQDNTWEEFPLNSFDRPVKRYWHQAAYISGEAGLFLFGGDNGFRYQEDSWFFDLDTQGWIRLRTEQSPPGRIVGSLTYSPDHDQIILFGGLDNDFENMDDTWIYSASTATWEQIGP